MSVTVAAILYVDDTGLLHMSTYPQTQDNEFLDQFQNAMT